MLELRPVSFHLKNDPGGAVQYGLIAEEVDKVYPELVIRDREGTIQGVRYDELAPMLLNEVERQQAQLAEQSEQSAEQQALIQDQARQLTDARTEIERANEERTVMQAKLTALSGLQTRVDALERVTAGLAGTRAAVTRSATTGTGSGDAATQ